MIKISEIPAAARIVEQVNLLFTGERGRVSYSLHKHICFICGAQGERLPNKKRTLRSEFRDFLQSSGSKFQILPIFAESAIEEFIRDGAKTFLDLGAFESLIANIVDSVLIFPESPGSYTELGYFASQQSIREKTLVASRSENQEPSFINLGPLPLINKDSKYQPTPIVIGNNLKNSFNQVAKKLTFFSSKEAYRKGFEFKQFKELDAKAQLVVIFETIRLFRFITESNLQTIIHRIFGPYDIDRVRRILSILVAMNFVYRTKFGDYVISPSPSPLLEYDGNRYNDTKLEIIGFYDKYEPSVKKIIGTSV